MLFEIELDTAAGAARSAKEEELLREGLAAMFHQRQG